MKIDFNTKKEQILNWVKENKLIVLLGIGGVATTVILAAGVIKSVNEEGIEDEFYLEPGEEDIPERDILMTFSDEATGKVLWKERCGEEYMNDFKDNGLEYEEVRKLNGIEEA